MHKEVGFIPPRSQSTPEFQKSKRKFTWKRRMPRDPFYTSLYFAKDILCEVIILEPRPPQTTLDPCPVNPSAFLFLALDLKNICVR